MASCLMLDGSWLAWSRMEKSHCIQRFVDYFHSRKSAINSDAHINFLKHKLFSFIGNCFGDKHSIFYQEMLIAINRKFQLKV